MINTAPLEFKRVTSTLFSEEKGDAESPASPPLQEVNKFNKAPGVDSFETALLPIRGGRSSVPDTKYSFKMAINGVNYTQLEPSFGIEWLPVLEYLAVFDQEISYAVDNILTLANCGHDIFFSEKVKDSAKKEMLNFIKENGKNWYQNSGGVNSLLNDLFIQTVINGCISAEIIPNARLDDIEQIERINPFQIRFFRDEVTSKYMPFQRTDTFSNVSTPGGYKQLNPLTYKYIALRRVHTGPYGTPPFLAALEASFIQTDMVKNFKFIMKKLGSLGTLAAYLTPPEPLNNETPENYLIRCQKYLDDQIPEIQRVASTGVIAGFDKRHRFEVTSVTGNAAGSDVLFGIVKRMKMAGLKQDPNLLGEQQSTTETFGRVLLAKLITQVANYQETVAAFLSELYYMGLLFAGFNPGKVEVIFKKPLIGDQLKEEQAYKAKLENLAVLQDRGIITQLQFAQEAGYDEPALAEKPAEPAPPAPGVKGEDPAKGGSKNPTKETDPTKETKGKTNAGRLIKADMAFFRGDAAIRDMLITDFIREIQGNSPAFDYRVPEGCLAPPLLKSVEQFDHFGDSFMDKFARKYVKSVYARFRKALSSIADSIKLSLGKLPSVAPPSEVVQVVLYEMYSKWPGLFARPIESQVNQMVKDIYRHYKTDKTVFGSLKRPAPSLSLHDYRAMDYMKDVDMMYLGRFITDPDTRKRVTRWIEDWYAKEDAPIGKNKQAINLFSKDFEETLSLEGWKIRRIIDTSVNKMRNYAHVSYLHDGKVESFEVAEVMDQITCDHCQHMDGKTFSVQKAFDKTKKVIEAGTDEVQKYSPFATDRKLEDFKLMDSEALQDAGFDTPPYHPHCRGRITAAD